MKFRASKKRNNGFTLVEMLAVMAIVAILLAIGIVAVVYYARWLHITELDNTAREIYLAAENRAVLLSAGGRLEEQVKAAAGGVEQTVTPPDKDKGATPLAAGGGAANAEYRYIYYSGDDSQLADLLPVGTIDPALREGCFYIVYEVNTGSVTDVFYAEDGNLLDNNANFQDFYETWWNSSRQKRLDAKRMIGYYGGEAAGNDKTNALKAPILIVHNEEELWVELTYEVPTGETLETRKPVVKLYHANGTERQYEIDLELSKWSLTGSTPGINGTTYTYALVLDSLEKSKKQFKDLYNGAVTGNKPSSFGWDFTVEAWIEGGTVRSPTASDTGNSLFADETHDSDTAYIGNLRHLQNLDKNHSDVGDKTKAVQIADIEQSTSNLVYYQDYEFKPIVNDELKSYCGSYGANGADSVTHFIKGLTVTADSAAGKSAGGLFATVPSGMEFQNVHLINTYVEAKGNTVQYLPAGALVGVATDTTFTNCWVYWEGEELEELKASITGTELKDDHYQIVGTEAGGLVGQLNGGTITDCLAATLVKGTNIAGGMVGQAKGKITVNTSYADCYLTAGTTIGGLIGEVEAGGTSSSTTLENVYTAGFIYVQKAKNVAGVCNCIGTIHGTNVYSAIQYLGLQEGVTIMPGVPSNNGTTATKCYYLEGNSTDNGNKKSYDEMAGDDFVETMGNAFERKGFDQSHPYNLLEGMALDVYPFPGLVGLPHYGDWNSKFIKPALVYYEQYKNNDKTEYGFYGNTVDCLRNNMVVPVDGYAVAFREEDLEDLGIVTKGDDGKAEAFTVGIQFTYPDENGAMKQPSSITYTYGQDLYTVEAEGVTYYLAPLPDDAINSQYASANFYQTVKFQITNGNNGGAETTYAYCPHFAKTAAPMSDMTGEQINVSIANMAKRAYGYVRTPRHLRALSRFETYAHGGKYDMNQTWVSHTYTYIQELDLDYETYEGYGWKTSWDNGAMYTQDPIGRFGAAFNGNYDGECHTIKNVKFALPEESTRQYAGLFGLSAGNLRNIVYLMNPEETISVSRSGVTLFLGALAGGNSGTITNCAVAGADLKGTIYNKAEAYVGGLVGINNGAIQNCAAEVASLKARGEDFSTARAGGLVGRNNGTIRTSYAVGHISGEALKDSSARVCGFVGYNTGSISYSYTATRLESSGAGVETFGFCGEKSGRQDHTYFVDSGNFTYRGEPYNGTYSTGAERADPVSYRVMTGGELAEGEEKPELVENGMAQGGKAEHDGNPPKKEGEPAPDFPLPTGVTKNGQPVHYGQWPEVLDLGDMGMYYWEKMELPGANGVREVYGISMLRVDADKKEVTDVSTLATAHSDGGVVMDYGYGFYCSKGKSSEVEIYTEGVCYTKDGNDMGNLVQSKMIEIETDKGTTMVPINPTLSELKDGSGSGAATDRIVDESLNQLMEQYEFFSYHSFVPNPNPNPGEGEKSFIRDGLYPEPGMFMHMVLSDDPNVVVGLAMGETKIRFRFNPHFAGALAVDESGMKGKGTESTTPWTVDPSLLIKPGTELSSPYQIRAMSQLSAINWNKATLDTKTVMVGETRTQDNGSNAVHFENNVADFFYLSRIDSNQDHYYGGIVAPENYPDQYNGNYFWKQTHDISGEIRENINGEIQKKSGVYTPIAEYYDVTEDAFGPGTTGKLWGWFGGTFDGDGYVIEDVNIQGQTASCVGLFGAVYNGLLENIVLYSSDGKGSVTNQVDTDHILTPWYSMGALAGIAVADNNNAVVNCSASGYTISIKTYNMQDNVWRKQGGGGSTVGGLIGASDMMLTGCSAVNTIEILPGDKENTVGNDNLRAGGLVGVCQNTIQDCYAGGNIIVNEKAVVKDGNGVYAGGITAGCFFKTLRIGTTSKTVGGKSAPNTLKNCYSYVELPDQDMMLLQSRGGTYENTRIRGLYAIGGLGDVNGSSRIENCYYLESAVMKNNKSDTGGYETITGMKTDIDRYGDELIALTYKQLANTGTADEKKVRDYPNIYGALNVGKTDTKDMFSPVTDTEDGFEVPGKYSYGAKEWLTGLRYPFPTILTRQIELGKPDRANVHYGDWPLNGIERVTGGAPIRLDLLKVGGEVKTEVLTLSAEVPEGGTWKIEEKEPAEGEAPIIKAHLGNTEGDTEIPNGGRSCQLTVEGLELGQTEVTVVYAKDGVEYGRVTITVNVTATLRVKSELSPIYVFPGAENVKVPLVLCDDEWNELTAQKLEDVEINLSKSVCRIPEELLSSAALAGDKEGGYYLFLKALPVTDEEKFDAAQAITVSVPYTYKEAEIEAEHSMLPVVMRPLPKPEAVTVEDKDITRITFAPLSLDEKDEAGEAVKANITVKGVTEVSVTEPTTEGGSSDDQMTDPETPEKPEGTVTFEGNVVKLENYVPGAEVTLTLELATKRSGADTTEQPTTQTVTMTVTIPKPEPEPDEGTPENPDPEKPEDGKTDLGTKQAENQETVEAAEPEPTQVPEPAAGEEAKLPEGPDPALPVEEKTDPVPEKDAGAGEDGTEPEQ